jgi:hypothetical protein
MKTRWFEKIGCFYSDKEFNITLNSDNGSVELKSKPLSLEGLKKHFIPLRLVNCNGEICFSDDGIWLSSVGSSTYIYPGVYSCSLRPGIIYTQIGLKLVFFKSLKHIAKRQWFPFKRR